MQAEAPLGLVISDVTVVSPERAVRLTHAYVRIIDDRIVELNQRPLRGAKEIDGTGRYLIPGLIDSHVHLAVSPGFPPGMKAEHAIEHPDIVAKAVAQDPRSYLFFGFTTVFDLIGAQDRTARWNALEIRPDAYFCGAVAVAEGKAYRVVFPVFSYDHAHSVGPMPSPIEEAVAAVVADGANCVKTFYDGSATSSMEDAKALVAEAHARHLPVFVHANSKEAQAFAVGVGVDVIVHGMWNGWQLTDDGGLPADVNEILSDVATRQIGYQPTIQVLSGLRDLMRSDYLARPELGDSYPTALINWYATKEGAWYADEIRKYPGFKGEVGFRESLDRASEVTRRLANDEAHLLFGSDTPSDKVYTNPPASTGGWK